MLLFILILFVVGLLVLRAAAVVMLFNPISFCCCACGVLEFFCLRFFAIYVVWFGGG